MDIKEWMGTVVGKVVSTVVGVALVLGFWTVKGWFTGDSGETPSGPPVPAARISLTVGDRAVSIGGWECFIHHPDEGAPYLEFKGEGLAFGGRMDVNGDGKRNDKDNDFGEDESEAATRRVLTGKRFQLEPEDDSVIPVDGKGSVQVAGGRIVAKELWRPKGYHGTDAWRGEIELDLVLPEGPATVRGTFEGPVTETW